MKYKLFILLMFLSISAFSQNNKVYENVDVKNKLYVGGDIIYKGETMTASRVFQDSITRISDSITELRSDIINHTISITKIDSYVDTTSYISVNDTISTLNVESPEKAYISDNDRTTFVPDTNIAGIKYTFPTFIPNGNITGVQIAIEYFMQDTSVIVMSFGYGNYRASVVFLPVKFNSDTIVTVGGNNNLLGLNILLDSLITTDTLNSSATISDMIEQDLFFLLLGSSDTVYIDNIKIRLFYTVAEQVTVTSDDLIIWQDFLYLIPREYAPAEAVEGLIYMDTDHHLYLYNGSQWKQLDN